MMWCGEAVEAQGEEMNQPKSLHHLVWGRVGVGAAVESRKALNLLRSTESAPRGRAEHVSEHATRQRLPAAALRLQNNETKGLLLVILATRNSAAGAEQREVF